MLIVENEADLESLKKAVYLLEASSITQKVAAVMGRPIEAALSKMPPKTREKINGIVSDALHKATDAALATLKNERGKEASPKLNKLAAATSGALGGFFGLPALAIELPVSTTIMLRAIADIARSEGFDLSELDTKLECIQVFALGGPASEDDATETAYYSSRVSSALIIRDVAAELTARAAKAAAEAAAKAAATAAANATQKTVIAAAESASTVTATQAIANLIEKVVVRFGGTITEAAIAKAVPLVGAATGAALNVMFTDFYQDMAGGHFIVKRLESRYGVEPVREEYMKIVHQIKEKARLAEK